VATTIRADIKNGRIEPLEAVELRCSIVFPFARARRGMAGRDRRYRAGNAPQFVDDANQALGRELLR
jgi:hypothetical protein